MSFIHWKPCQVCTGCVMALQKACIRTLGALRPLMLSACARGPLAERSLTAHDKARDRHSRPWNEIFLTEGHFAFRLPTR